MIIIGLVLVILVAVADYLTGTEIAFSIFYLIPVALVSWHSGLKPGIVFSVICAVLWHVAEAVGGHLYSNPATAFWNASVRGIIFLLTAILLSRLKQAHKTEKEAREAANLATRAKSDFLANMSHEIRTPLNSILATAELLAESPLDAELTEYVRILDRESRHLLRLINDILDLSKVETGLYELQKIPFDLQGLIEEIVSTMGVRVHEKGLELDSQIEPGMPLKVAGDPDCLRRVILNLVGNAIKFTEKGEVSIRVKSDPRQPVPGHFHFSVADTGIGIPREKLLLIFERFTQADFSITRKYGGTGLGLAISRKLVELMGGTLSVESVPGQGSTFLFTIPLEIVDQKFPVQASAPEKESLRAQGGRELRILLVDDYETNRRLIRAFLQNAPCRIDEAENGRAALDKFSTDAYDIVLMDMQMPVMSGEEATREIRRRERENSLMPVPIVALTAHAFAEDAQKSLAAGCNVHLTKPLTRSKLLDTIYSLVRTEGKPEETETVRSERETVAVPAGLQALVPAFLEEMRSFRGVMQEAVEKGDLETVRDTGHKIRGAGGSYGFQTISDIGGWLEAAAKESRKDEIRVLLQKFTEYLNKVEVRYE